MMKFLIWSTVGLSMAIMMPLRSHAVGNQGTQTTSRPIKETLMAQKFIPSNLQQLYEDSANSPNRNPSNTPSPMTGDRFNNPTSPTPSNDPMVSPVPDRVNNPVRVPNTTTDRFTPGSPNNNTIDRIDVDTTAPNTITNPNAPTTSPTSDPQLNNPNQMNVPQDQINSNPVRVPNTTTERFDPNAPAPMTTDRINEGSSQPTNMNDPNNRYPGSSSPNQLNNQSPNQMDNPGTVNNQPTTGGEPIQGLW